MRSTRIRPGEAHENGVVEQKHYRTKSALAQALVIRGSKDFASVEEYQAFVREVVEESNRSARTEAGARAGARCSPCRPRAVPFHTTFHPHVTCWSTVRVGGRIYSVPSRLIGHDVEVRQHPDAVEVFYAGKLVETMPRIRGEKPARIDYRHVIWSLVRKPGAFARYRYREELFPSLTSAGPTTPCARGRRDARTSSTCGSCTWPRARWSRWWKRLWPRCSPAARSSTTPG